MRRSSSFDLERAVLGAYALSRATERHSLAPLIVIRRNSEHRSGDRAREATEVRPLDLPFRSPFQAIGLPALSPS